MTLSQNLWRCYDRLTRFRLNLMLIDLCVDTTSATVATEKLVYFDSGGVPFWPSFAVGTEKVIKIGV